MRGTPLPIAHRHFSMALVFADAAILRISFLPAVWAPIGLAGGTSAAPEAWSLVLLNSRYRP